MCVATLSLVAGIAGAGVSAVGAIQQGQATEQAQTYQAEVAANNAKIAQQNANAATQAGVSQAEASSLKNSDQTNAVRAAIAANGIDVNSGSAVDVQESQREVGKIDTENVAHNAALQAYGYRSQSSNYMAQSQLDQAAADQAPIAAAFSAAGGLLGSASSLGGKWSNPASTSSGTNV